MHHISKECTPVELRNVTKRFGKGKHEVTAVKEFSFQFPAGKMVTLLGPSGCGKTTALRCIAGFYEPEEGDIIIGGRRVNGIPPYDRPTGMVFQNYALFPHMTVFENIAYGLRVKKFSSREIQEKVKWALDLLQLNGMQGRSPSQLSGGQQQRVAIARVLVNEPQVLLFDEPLSNLDAKLRVYMRGEIRGLQEKLKTTTIYVTHDQEEAMSISDIMVLVNQGKIEQIGTPLEIYRRPRTDFAAEFIGLTNFVNARITGVSENRLKLSLYGIELMAQRMDQFEVDETVQVVFRPEMIHLSEPKGNTIGGKVLEVAFLGPITRYTIELEGGDILTLDDQNPSTFHQKGSEVHVEIDEDSLHIQRPQGKPDPRIR
ncbi:MAG: ABC transporter ATP-binding protein [Thermodesulfobacteriota bacterium]